jgi:hypothetical protein
VDGAFLVNLDSVAQRDTFDNDPVQARESLTGVLRIGSLLTRTLLLTDAQVLDGVLLQQVGPRGVSQRIGLGWEIYSRRSTLEESLAAFFDPEGPTLRYIELSSLLGYSQKERAEIGKKIASFPSEKFRSMCTEVGTVRAICSVLRESGVDDQNLENLAQYWESWIDEDRSGGILVRHKPIGRLSMVDQAERKPLSTIIRNPKNVTQILNEVQASATRSEIRAVILELGLSEEETMAAREWLDAVYVCSIATQYGTIAIEIPRSSVASLNNRRASEEATIRLSKESLDRLSQIRVATFEVICDKAREDVRLWRSTRRKRHIRHIATTIQRDTTSDSDVRRERIRSAIRLAVVAAVVQITMSFDYAFPANIAIMLGAVVLTELGPVLYSILFPKGRLTATVDPLE